MHTATVRASLGSGPPEDPPVVAARRHLNSKLAFKAMLKAKCDAVNVRIQRYKWWISS